MNDHQSNQKDKKNKNIKKKNQIDIKEEQILKNVQRDFIKAYMSAYSNKQVSDKEINMFTRYLKNIKPLNTSSNHYLNRLKSLCNEMRTYYSQFQKLNNILGTNFDKE